MYKNYLMITLLAALLGCSTTMQVTKLDDHGYYPTDSRLEPDDILVRKPFSNKYKNLLYVKTDATYQKYTNFLVTSFENMHVFSSVMQEEKLESLIVHRNIANKVSNVSNLIGLKQLETQIGPFLVVEPYVESMGGSHLTAQLKFIDPETGDIVLLLRKKAFVWSGLDEPLFYPLFNGFIDWANNRPL